MGKRFGAIQESSDFFRRMQPAAVTIPSAMTHSPEQQRLASDLIRQALAENPRWLKTVLRARGVEPAEIEDVLQEVNAAAIENASQLRDPTKVAPWLYRIAVVNALQYRRRTGRRRKLVDGFVSSNNELTTSAEPEPLAWLLADEQRQLVRQAVATLSPKDAEILLLKHTEDWSYRQLADHLDISESAVDARLHRARAKMRRALANLAPALVPK